MSETFTDNRQASRFELDVDGVLAYADYRRGDGEMVIPYVYADPALRGTGAADRLMRQVKAIADAEQRSITPICGYAAAWLRRNARP
jgi:uncharacterized protein